MAGRAIPNDHRPLTTDTTEMLDQDLQSFLKDYIESYEQVTALTLLHATAPQMWSSQEVAEKLGITPALAAEAIERLQRRNLIASSSDAGSARFGYRIGDANLDMLVERLSRASQEQLVELIKLLSSNAIERIRTSAIRTFADAFIWRRHG